ncbi:TetR/AcrR family transcriptional regulator [Natrarchaeobaculum sulfurireducens]|uniref:Transcriptional regulator, TetR family n=1 Tax=Natrarchaeobaculum sulfurireducens TaxID=2044521 RepID=A0A346PI33_9EURY|nr:TetR/AcrR family transcriptional regulator [Natrarchaeobaculum sulfurireducens]AXR79178.1 Transcriptional regulator, TetR/AcrR family [Natrarchaeobaculum sulfurireducens]AXR80776.1 Transcriptional regulator, TetR family [Natrarchaeobaculum sulfurireducens]
MKGFSEKERERIRERLLEEGQQLFSRFGPERTRVKDVTDASDIGTSTFYSFFDSKQELYIEVLIREHKAFHEAIEAAIDGVEDPREQVHITLETIFEELESNPLIYSLIVEGELYSLRTWLSDEERSRIVERIRGRRLGAIDEWVSDPSFAVDDPAVADALLRHIVFVSQAQGVQVDTDEHPDYEAVRSVLVDIIVDGLFESS